MGTMPESLKAVGQLYPEKHAIVTSIPSVWSWVKKPTRALHEWISPCGDNCDSRDKLYDNMFNHLKTDESAEGTPQGKTTLTILDKANRSTPYIPSS
nr:hypothetical protein [Tolivirales sp.]